MALGIERDGLSPYGTARRLFNACAAAALLVAALVMPSAGAAAAETVRLLALGDSLTAGYGLPEGQGFTARLQAALRAEGYPVEVINAGVSGDTTAGGRARLGWALADAPDAAIVALGANDMLRGIDPAVARANLDAILGELKARGIPVLLAGMLANPSLGRAYTDRFDAIHPELAEKHGVPLYPFFLEGVATDPALNQGDGIHPNAAGVDEIVRRILPHVVMLIEPLTGAGERPATRG
ncbi:arylesterase [Azospirillum halopraeferens]|uniref:arylesterase n=1 Tax=Azospirillum halopraeferens TaxID=34010 RepID=UPI000412F35B|nr:arylesterase [Azospirillum halopraeferens]